MKTNEWDDNGLAEALEALRAEGNTKFERYIYFTKPAFFYKGQASYIGFQGKAYLTLSNNAGYIEISPKRIRKKNLSDPLFALSLKLLKKIPKKYCDENDKCKLFFTDFGEPFSFLWPRYNLYLDSRLHAEEEDETNGLHQTGLLFQLTKVNKPDEAPIEKAFFINLIAGGPFLIGYIDEFEIRSLRGLTGCDYFVEF